MSSSITSSDHHLPISQRRSKPLSLRDHLLDDLSSCSSNGFKSFPRRLLHAEIKRSGMLHRKRRPNCGLAFSHAVQKISTALLSAVKLLPFPSSSVKPLPPRKKEMFSRNLWKKFSHRELNNVDDGEVEGKTEEQRIHRGRSFGEFLKESLDEPSNVASSGGGSELFTNSEVTQSSGESETSKENDAVGDETEETTRAVVVMMSGDCVGPLVSERSSVNDNRKECVNEEKEQVSPISILECPFQDNAITPHSLQKETDEKKLLRKSRIFETLEWFGPVDLEKCIEQYVGRQDYGSHCMVGIEEDQSEKRANRLLALVKSRMIEEPSPLLVSQKVDNLLLDFFKEEGDNETRDEAMLVTIVEEWVMRRQEEEYMFMSWEVEDKY